MNPPSQVLAITLLFAAGTNYHAPAQVAERAGFEPATELLAL